MMKPSSIQILSLQSGSINIVNRYTIFNLIPKSLFLQFQRAANIYFLIISVLTSLSFSPKSPASMIATFAIVLVFTMIKEAYEDWARHKQDTEINLRQIEVYNHPRREWMMRQWFDIKLGQLVKIEKDSEFPADMFLLKSSRENGVAFVDTLNLDGESNLKQKQAMTQIQSLKDEDAWNFDGEIHCDVANENLEKWDSQLKSEQIQEVL